MADVAAEDIADGTLVQCDPCDDATSDGTPPLRPSADKVFCETKGAVGGMVFDTGVGNVSETGNGVGVTAGTGGGTGGIGIDAGPGPSVGIVGILSNWSTA